MSKIKSNTVAVIALAIAISIIAFDVRDCAVAQFRVDDSIQFHSLDSQFFYEEQVVNATLENITGRGPGIYGWTEILLDVPFALFYGTLLWLIVGAAYPQDRRFRKVALALPLAAASFDILENLTIAIMVFFSNTTSMLGGFVVCFSMLKWIFVILTSATILVSLVLFHRKRALLLTQYIFFARIPILLGTVIVAIAHLGTRNACQSPAVNIDGLPTVQNMLDLDNSFQAGTATFFLFLASSVVIFCGTHIWRLAQERFGVEKLGLEVEDDEGSMRAKLFRLSSFSFLLSVPIVVQFVQGVGSTAIGAVLTATGLGIIVLFLIYRIRQTLVDCTTPSKWPPWPPWLTSKQFHKFLSHVSQKIVSGIEQVLGPGYVMQDYGKKRLIPGHALAASVMIVLGAVYFVGYWVWIPSEAMHDVPPIAYVMLLIAFACAVFTNLTFIFDRLRIPVILFFIAWLAAWAYLPGYWDTEHYFDADFKAQRGSTPPTVQQAFNARANNMDKDLQLITVISVSGGGIQAAGWAAEVLAGLSQDEEMGTDFTKSIFLLSSTSGGSVGVYYYLEALREGEQYLPKVPMAAQASSLEATAWGLVFPDLKRLIVPFLVYKDRHIRHDRAWASEQAWLRWRNCMFEESTDVDGSFERNRACRRPVKSKNATLMSDWWSAAQKGLLPGVIFNATIVEDGEQFLATNLDLREFDLASRSSSRFASTENWTFGPFDSNLCGHFPEPDTEKRLSPDTEEGLMIDREHKPCPATQRFLDMKAVTAARLSATFPYVTPVARADVKTKEVESWHIGDGGYFDNFGAVAIVRWIDAIRPYMRDHENTKSARVLFIQINAFPTGDSDATGGGEGWTSALMGPIQAIVNVRTSSQLARNDLELSLLEHSLGECFEAVEFRPRALGKRQSPPLSWELSDEDIEQMKVDWQRNADRVEYIKDSYFGDGKSAGDKRCREQLQGQE